MSVLQCSQFSQAQAPVQLRYHFTKGDKLRYLIETKSKHKIVLAGTQTESETTETMNVTWFVTSVDERGVATLTQTVERIRFQEAGEFTFDSKDPNKLQGSTPEGLGELLRTLSRAELSMTISPQGETHDVSLSDKFVRSLRPLLATKPGLKLDDRIADLLGVGIQPSLAPGPVTKDQSWQGRRKNLKSPLSGTRAALTYTYVGPKTIDDKRVEQIDMSSRDAFRHRFRGQQTEVAGGKGNRLLPKGLGASHKNETRDAP